jgi:glyoxylase-like metal-dependent hydrolase (beta-lactamase superfamily II)
MPDLETCEQIAEDIYLIRLPLPFALSIVNCYLLRGNDGWTVIDAGINTPDGQATWHGVFDRLHLRPQEIEQIVLTHVHPDHYGLSGWLQALAGENGTTPPVYTSPREAALAEILWGDETRENKFYDLLTSAGMPEQMVKQVATGFDSTRMMTQPPPQGLETINPGDRVRLGGRDFDAIHAPGHSDGQLIFYDADDRLLLSGDHVLMKITPNIGLWPDTDDDPLGRFMGSLRTLRSLDVRLALPGHRQVILDWRGRLDELLDHHEQRLGHTMAAVDGGATVYEASLQVFESQRFTTHEWRFAVAETLAHLEYLRLRGRLRREDGAVWRYDPV